LDKKRIVFVFSLISILAISNIAFLSFAESEWQTQKIVVEDQTFKVPYKITNGEVLGMESTLGLGGLRIHIKSDEHNNGKIEVLVPRNLLDAKKPANLSPDDMLAGKTVNREDLEDDELFILADGEEIKSYTEIGGSPCFRSLSINFPAGSKEIEIIGGLLIGLQGPPITPVKPVNVVNPKDNYEPGEPITISGCTDLALYDEKLTLEVLNPKGELYKTMFVIPKIDGTFSTSFTIDNAEPEGTYITNVTYAGKSTITSFVVPEFSGISLIILVTALSAVLGTRLITKINVKMY